MIWTCNFCLTSYDSEKKPKVQGVNGGIGMYICATCLKAATAICKQELGPDWPKKKPEPPKSGA